MKIVIDIPDNEVPKRREILEIGLQFMDGEVCECTYPFQVLPKGHGRLKDIDEVEQLLDLDSPDNVIAQVLKNLIESVPTIIEADMKEENE